MLDFADEFYGGNGNGNKMNLRVEILENLLKANSDRTSAKVNSLRQAIHRCKTDFADTLGSSMDLVRQVFQPEMTDEIREVIDRHLRTTFSPAFENLRRNGYDITDEELNELCCNILEAAKEPFLHPGSDEFQKNSRMVIPAGSCLKPKAPISALNGDDDRRRAYESDDNESDTSMNSLSQLQQQYPGMDVSKFFHRPKKRGRPRKVDVDSGRCGTPIMHGTQPVTFSEAHKWNPERIHKDSKFVLGSKVNKILSMGHRGHIFVKYPRIFRYVGDDEDKSWLFDRNISTRMSGKVFFMLFEDVMELAALENAQGNIRNDIHRCSFVVPERLIMKMKMFMSKPFDMLKSRVSAASPLNVNPSPVGMSPHTAPQMLSPNMMSAAAAMTNMAIQQNAQQSANQNRGQIFNNLGSLNGQTVNSSQQNGGIDISNSLLNLISSASTQPTMIPPSATLGGGVSGLNSALSGLQMQHQNASQSHLMGQLGPQNGQINGTEVPGFGFIMR